MIVLFVHTDNSSTSLLLAPQPQFISCLPCNPLFLQGVFKQYDMLTYESGLSLTLQTRLQATRTLRRSKKLTALNLTSTCLSVGAHDDKPHPRLVIKPIGSSVRVSKGLPLSSYLSSRDHTQIYCCLTERDRQTDG